MLGENHWIACDESGNTGENLTGSELGVFSEGSHDLSMDESEELLEWVLKRTTRKATEIKWKHLKDDADLVDELFEVRLSGRAMFYLSEKRFVLVGKVVDLLLEELAHERGDDMYGSGEARRLAFALYRDGARALGDERWAELLQAFNSLARVDSRNQQRKAVPKETVEGFFLKLENARFKATRRNVEDVLTELLGARGIADTLVSKLDPGQSEIPALDPLIPSLAQTIREWHDRDRSKIINVIHDVGPVPSSTAMEHMANALRSPSPEFRRLAPPVRVGQILTGDSKSDARIQIADFVAGLGATIGMDALKGQLDPRGSRFARSMLIDSSLWGDDRSASELGLAA